MAIAILKPILPDDLSKELLTLMDYPVWQLALGQYSRYSQTRLAIFSAPEHNVLLRQMEPLDLIALGQP